MTAPRQTGRCPADARPPAADAPARCALSVVVPAYNEAGRLPGTLQRLREWFAARGEAVEVLVVDDGSTDGTGAVVDAFEAGPLRLRLLRSPRNRGKGHAVRTGMLAAGGERILMTDADLSAPIEELDKLLAWLDRGCDVAIGSRDMPESVLQRPQPWHRRLMGRALRALRRRLLLADLLDTQCGFKCFSRQAARAAFARQRTEGFAFDCEVLALVRLLGYRIREVGVVWRNDPQSRVRPLRDGLRMLASLLAIQRRLRRLGS